MRLAPILPGTLLLAACSAGAGAPQEEGAEKIACSLGGATQFAQDCVLERGAVDGVANYVIRHPNGEFHRLEASPDGQQLLAADGAEVTQSALKKDRYEVILGDNRYVIPLNAPAH